ncbi:MAG: hypothetical protein KF795_02590 [Labilithrix sp.]|nr:hypothetical protein [Labilithrix sp.]
MSCRARVRFLVCAIVLAGASPAGARAAEGPDDVAEARADYDAAAAAYDREDYATAAARFARADERSPDPRALQLAMAAALLASDAALAMNLVDRSEARGGEQTSSSIASLARQLRARFENRAARVRLVCATSCSATLDGAVMPSSSRWVAPGRHVIAFDAADGSHLEIALALAAGQTIDVPVDAPDAARALDDRRAPTPSARERRGPAPAFFWAAAGATAAAAGVATVFTVVLEGRHDDFVARPSAETAAAGDRAQTNARVAWAVTGALAVTTGVLALLTDFGGARTARARGPRVALGWSGLSIAGRFE